MGRMLRSRGYNQEQLQVRTDGAQVVGAPTKTTQQEEKDGLETGKMPNDLPALGRGNKPC